MIHTDAAQAVGKINVQVDEPCDDIDHLWKLMQGMTSPYAGGLASYAISAIDLALWDLLGKHLNAPVWRLLGGRKAERMPAYASGGWADAEHIGDQLLGYIDKGGFGAVKMRVGVIECRCSSSRA